MVFACVSHLTPIGPVFAGPPVFLLKKFLDVSSKTWHMPRRVDANLKKAEHVARFLACKLNCLMFEVLVNSRF